MIAEKDKSKYKSKQIKKFILENDIEDINNNTSFDKLKENELLILILKELKIISKKLDSNI